MKGEETKYEGGKKREERKGPDGNVQDQDNTGKRKEEKRGRGRGKERRNLTLRHCENMKRTNPVLLSYRFSTFWTALLGISLCLVLSFWHGIFFVSDDDTKKFTDGCYCYCCHNGYALR